MAILPAQLVRAYHSTCSAGSQTPRNRAPNSFSALSREMSTVTPRWDKSREASAAPLPLARTRLLRRGHREGPQNATEKVSFIVADSGSGSTMAVATSVRPPRDRRDCPRQLPRRDSVGLRVSDLTVPRRLPGTVTKHDSSLVGAPGMSEATPAS